MKQLLFASTNAGKIAEMHEIASPLGITIINPKDLVPTSGPVPDVEEGVESYRENALKKAEAFFIWSKLPCVADDAGLEVKALGGAPGVKSARFAGDQASMDQNKKLLLEKLTAVSDRAACFRSVLCYFDGIHEPIFSEATLEGSISQVEQGKGGFGYDPLLFVAGYEKTLSELKETMKVETHREKAFKLLLKELSAKRILPIS